MVQQFLPFGLGVGANILTQAQWDTDHDRVQGFTKGLAPSIKANTAWRQCAFVTACISYLIADTLFEDVLDNGDIARYVDQLRRMMIEVTGGPDAPDDGRQYIRMWRRWVLGTEYYVPLAGTDGIVPGGRMTGFLTLSAHPVNPFHAATKQYVDNADQAIYNWVNANFLNLAGGTMRGYITLHADPTQPAHAVTKRYVDAAINEIKDNYLPLAGGTMRGYINLHAYPTLEMHAANKGYVDQRDNAVMDWINGNFVPLWGTDVVPYGRMWGFITLHAHPVYEFHAATKGYVDQAVGNLWQQITDWVNGNFLSIWGGQMYGYIRLHDVTPYDDYHVASKWYVDQAKNWLYSWVQDWVPAWTEWYVNSRGFIGDAPWGALYARQNGQWVPFSIPGGPDVSGFLTANGDACMGFRYTCLNPYTAYTVQGGSWWVDMYQSTWRHYIIGFGMTPPVFQNGQWYDGTAWRFVDGLYEGDWAWIAYGYSDERIKHNIKPSTHDALATLRQIEFFEFDYNNPLYQPQHRNVGFIAQQFRDAIPEAIRTEFGAPNLLRIDDTTVQPYLARAIQQLAEQNEELRAELSELRSKLDG